MIMTYLLALLTGGLAALPFKLPQSALINWLVLVPLFYQLDGQNNKESFLIGWSFGFGFFGLTGYWLIYPILNFSGYPWPLAGLLVALAISLLGVYSGLFGLISNFIERNTDWDFFIIVPIVWTGLEVIRTFFSFEFQFGFFGYSQTSIPQLIQLARYGGVYLVSCLLVLVNSLFYRGFYITNKRQKLISIAGAIILFISIFSYGQFQLKADPNQAADNSEISLGVVQPSIPQAVKLNPEEQTRIINRLKMLSNQLLEESKPELLIWPETAILRGYNPEAKFPYRLAKPVPLFLGGHIYKDGVGPFNSALLVKNEREITRYYSKNKLVPWGEYVPLPWLIPDFIADI